MVNNRWRLRRIWSIETAMLDLEMDDQEDDIAADRGDIDEVIRIALAFKSLAEESALALLNRYEARLRRQYNGPRQPPRSPGRASRIRRNNRTASQPPASPTPINSQATPHQHPTADATPTTKNDQTNPPSPSASPPTPPADSSQGPPDGEAAVKIAMVE